MYIAINIVRWAILFGGIGFLCWIINDLIEGNDIKEVKMNEDTEMDEQYFILGEIENMLKKYAFSIQECEDDRGGMVATFATSAETGMTWEVTVYRIDEHS